MAVSKTPVLVGALAGAGIAVAAMAGVGLHPAGFLDADQGRVIKASTEPVLPSAPGAPLSFADIFEKVSPAVVSINVTSKADPTAMRRIPGFENFPFDLVPRGQSPGGEGDDGDAELRLVSKDKGPLKWTVGVFYEAQTRNLYQDTPTPGFDTLSYENFYYGPFNTPDGLYNSKTVDAAFNPNDIFSGLQNVSDSQVAIYTDDTWHVTHKLDLTAGVRYFDYHEKYYLFESGVYGVINHVPLILNTKQASNGFNPRFNASYHVDEDLMVYAEAAKGFRFGGANQPVPEGSSGIALQCQQNLAAYGYASAPLTFGPDHLWNYSVGEKARLANGRMTLNADYYYIDWQDVQTRLSLNCSYFFTENKGSVISQGVEAESTFRLTPEITLSGSFAYNSSRANGDIPTVGAFNGDQSPYAPNWTASAFVFYDRHLYEGMLHLQLSYHFRGEENTTYDPYATSFNVSTGALTKTGANQNFAIIPATQDVSAAITYEVGRYELGVYGNNLTDGVKVTNIAPATYFAIYQAGAQETVARPRTVGMRLKAKF